MLFRSILIIERFDSNKVWTAVLYDADQNYPYAKRFQLEAGNKHQNFLGDNELSSLYLLSSHAYPSIEVVLGGNDEFRGSLVVDVEMFIGVKSFKAKGKRLTTFEVSRIFELDPVRLPEEEDSDIDNDNIEDEEQDDNAQMDLFK